MFSTSTQLKILEDKAPSFGEALKKTGVNELKAAPLKTFQLNVGRWCNQACLHCHVEASPLRTEAMTREVMERCLEIITQVSSIDTVDITGGAPEGHPLFRELVVRIHAMGKHLIDRCNLTILQEPGQEDLAEFLHEHQVEIIASLPHFASARTDAQRGKGVFDRSIKALKHLNSLGYGDVLPLNLVYNPSGTFLSGNQIQLEREFREKLFSEYEIQFNHLYCINNMPINRYLAALERSGKTEKYLDTLVQAFNPATLPGLMCRSQISVGYDGKIYDCDFNQMLDLEVSEFQHINQFELSAFQNRSIKTANHCYGCTAGAGSSCGGAVA